MTVREVENVIQNRPVVSRKGSVRRDPNIRARKNFRRSSGN